MEQQAQTRLVHPGGFVGGVVRIPGDKSISHRVVLLAGLAAGTSEVRGFLQTEDCLNTLKAMESFGARSWFDESGVLFIQGTNGKMLEPAGVLGVGNSATGMRILAGLCAGAEMTVTLAGDSSFSHMSMRTIQEPLELMGARISLSPDGTAPMTIRGGHLHGLEYCLPVASAQVKTCCLLAGMYADGPTLVLEPVPTRDHTERMLRWRGVDLRVDGPRIAVRGYGAKGPRWDAFPFEIPGNFSAAAYWLAAAAATPGVTVRAERVGLNPRRTSFLGVLGRMGARVDIEPLFPGAYTEPMGHVTVSGAPLHGVEVEGEELPNLVDEIPLVAALGALAKGRTVLRDTVGFLSAREGNLLSRVAENLSAFGAHARAGDGELSVEGPSRLRPRAALKTHADPRMAMTLAILSIFAEEPVLLSGISCVDNLYPGFWNHLATLGVNVE